MEIPSFHDGYLIGIQVLEKDVRLSLTSYNGEAWEIELTGVEGLHMDDFQQSNIISHAEIIQNTRPDALIMERLFPGPHPSVDQQYQDAYSAFLEKKMVAIEAGQAMVMSIEPSYGADFVAYASGVSAKRLQD
ncbi:MAG: hypothetical protein ACTHLA_04215 [Asticcacaulis sp.]|uniref:hypothetical protein n=1 Tax=Asticcacaulis sp. TaxID=1872648 RepID=UPI003F7BB1BB